MYIEVSVLFDIFVGTLGTIALIFAILCLVKLSRVLSNINALLETNKQNIDSTLQNTKDITDNVKDISDVATEATAEAIVMKDNLSDKIGTVTDIASIVASTFLKK